jgi:hypothetical protein
LLAVAAGDTGIVADLLANGEGGGGWVQQQRVVWGLGRERGRSALSERVSEGGGCGYCLLAVAAGGTGIAADLLANGEGGVGG